MTVKNKISAKKKKPVKNGKSASIPNTNVRKKTKKKSLIGVDPLAWLKQDDIDPAYDKPGNYSSADDKDNVSNNQNRHGEAADEVKIETDPVINNMVEITSMLLRRSADNKLTINFDNRTTVDSSFLQLLACFRKNDISIVITNASDDLYRLSALLGLSEDDHKQHSN